MLHGGASFMANGHVNLNAKNPRRDIFMDVKVGKLCLLPLLRWDLGLPFRRIHKQREGDGLGLPDAEGGLDPLVGEDGVEVDPDLLVAGDGARVNRGPLVEDGLRWPLIEEPNGMKFAWTRTDGTWYNLVLLIYEYGQ